ncbi:efflux RND transporter permease subunit [Thermoanaerobacterium thermosaccharolyticum]|uniref:efflux RND transporter permease subunit n=1 Tax=Thermoanaerobacterium thermosaccharolyticum TaxID=1517 RepID=UPI003D2AEB67
MGIIDTAIKRPVTAFMAVVLIFILGFVSLTKMNVDLLPDINYPAIAVVTTYSGASSEEIESLITDPIENQLAGLQNVQNISSSSQTNVSIVTINFNWGTNLDSAVTDVRDKINIVKNMLPDGASDPTIVKFDISSMPVITYGLTGSNNQLLMKQVAEDVIQKKLETVAGVASVNISGGVDRQVRVLVSPEKMNGYGISFTQVTQVLQSNNVNLPAGTVDYGSRELMVRTMGEFQSVDDIKNIPIANKQGSIIRLRDIADVEDATADVTSYSRINKSPGLVIQVQKASDANTVTVANNVKKELESLQKQLPKGMTLYKISDESEYINDSINTLISHGIIGALLAVIIIYLFLHSFSSTLVVATSIPISLISTFILMYFSGMTLNIMSLGGLAMAIGRLEDDAIVVLENIHYHRQQGMNAFEAATIGAKEMFLSITASTLTTVVVFLPVIFVNGISGVLFKELSLTITFALLSSLVCAMTIVPLLSSRLVKVSTVNIEKRSLLGKIFYPMDKAYSTVEKKYGALLKWSLNHKKTVILSIIGLLIISIAAIPLVGTEFFPTTDEGQISISIQYPIGTKLEKTDQLVKTIENKIASIKEVSMYSSQVGTSSSGGLSGSSSSSSESASISVRLVPLSDRKRSTDEIAEELRQKIGQVPGAKIVVNSVSQTGSAGGSSHPIQIALKGDDFDTLQNLADRVKTTVEKVQGTRNVETSFEEGRPELEIIIDKDKASSYGLDANQIGQLIRTSIAGATATKYKVAGTEIDVNVQLDELSTKTFEDLENFSLLTASGVNVPIKDIAKFNITEGQNVIQHEDRTRIAYVTADIFGRSLGSVMNDIEASVSSMNLPEGYTVSFEGQNKDMQDSFAQLGQALLLSIVLVFVVMAAEFESLIHPFTIMFSIPLCIIGIVFGLLISGWALSIPAFLGIIMVVGIAVSNGILLVDYINKLRERGKNVTDAILEAGPRRLRPIIMTATATILGMLPIALGVGSGSEIEAPLAVSAIGGLTTSTLLTLILVPVLYSLFDNMRNKTKDRFSTLKARFSKKAV